MVVMRRGMVGCVEGARNARRMCVRTRGTEESLSHVASWKTASLKVQLCVRIQQQYRPPDKFPSRLVLSRASERAVNQCLCAVVVMFVVGRLEVG